MTTAKRGGTKKTGKSGAGKQSPPSSARVERARKSTSRVSDDESQRNLPKLGKNEVGGGTRGGRLH
jgi:hypothetical protein